MAKSEVDGPGADVVLDEGQAINKFELTKAEDWLTVVRKALPLTDDEVETLGLAELIPSSLRKSGTEFSALTTDAGALKKFGHVFANWHKLLELGWIPVEQTMNIFGANIQGVLDFDIRPGVPEGAKPRGEIYIFADNILPASFGETLLFPLRDNGFVLDTLIQGHHQKSLGTPAVFATFSKGFNRHAVRF